MFASGTHMEKKFTASDLRRFAMRCAAEVRETSNPAERAGLEKMAAAFLQLAKNEDWLNGNWRAHPDLHDDPVLQQLLEKFAGQDKTPPK